MRGEPPAAAAAKAKAKATADDGDTMAGRLASRLHGFYGLECGGRASSSSAINPGQPP